jgi:hypothetical protein
MAAVALAFVAAAPVTAICGCGETGEQPATHLAWQPFTDETHGFGLYVQQPFVAAVDGQDGRFWRVHFAAVGRTPSPGATAPVGGHGGLTITAWKLRPGERVSAARLIDVAPRLTLDELSGRLGGADRDATVSATTTGGARGTTIIQPFQPLVIEGLRGLEMSYLRSTAGEAAGGDRRTDVFVFVNDGWMLRFAVVGDETFWRGDGLRLRKSIDTLELFAPAGK